MTRFLTAADTRYEIRRYRYGRQNRPVLVFLHEGLGCVEMWKNFPERLAELTDCDAFVFSRSGMVNRILTHCPGNSISCTLRR